MNIKGGIFYRLTFKNDVAPDNFLTTLSTMIKENPERDKATRLGMFSRMSIFASIHSRIDAAGNEGEELIVKYLFLVEGNMGKLAWLVKLLEQFGEVSFPLDDDDWSFSSDTDILSGVAP